MLDLAAKPAYRRTFAALALVLGSCVDGAKAFDLCVDMMATVVSVTDPANLLRGALQPGDSLFADYSYDTTSPDLDGRRDNRGYYESTSGLTTMSVVGSGLFFRGALGDHPLRIEVLDNDLFFGDAFQVWSTENSGLGHLQEIDITLLQVRLRAGNNAISSAALMRRTSPFGQRRSCASTAARTGRAKRSASWRSSSPPCATKPVCSAPAPTATSSACSFLPTWIPSSMPAICSKARHVSGRFCVVRTATH
jgi:hypothetical protein